MRVQFVHWNIRVGLAQVSTICTFQYQYVVCLLKGFPLAHCTGGSFQSMVCLEERGGSAGEGGGVGQGQ